MYVTKKLVFIITTERLVSQKTKIAAAKQSVQIISKRNIKLTAPKIIANFKRDKLKDMSLSTIKRILSSANLHGRVAVYKPLLRYINRLKRLKWGEKHKA